jgi:proteasome lid subunit RPN8/RPN11
MFSYQVEEISDERFGDPAKPLRRWSVPQCPFSIDYSEPLLAGIVREVEAGLNAPKGESETGGVLFGRRREDRIEILAYRTLCCEHALGPGFILSEKDQRHLRELIASAGAVGELNGLQALGWYHSHIRSAIFLSERDLDIHSRYFGAPFQVALVLRPRSDGPFGAGFFFRDLTGSMRTESSYREFILETPRPAPDVRQAAAYHASATQREDAQVSTPRLPRPLVCPKCGSTHVHRSHRMNAFERLRGVLGYRPYRCNECLSRNFIKSPADSSKRGRSSPKRPEERRRAWLRTRREVLLWGAGVFGFLLILLYLIRDTTPKADQP